MKSGDVLLLEAQTTSSTMSGYLPVEVEQATFDAIQYATSNGIIVVEAGGNGSNDLDTYKDSNGKLILNRNSNDFRDSGAIMVGAASSSTPHSRSGFSNYGSRIDCFTVGATASTPLATAGRATLLTRTPHPLAELRELLPSLPAPRSSCSPGSLSTANSIRPPACARC